MTNKEIVLFLETKERKYNTIKEIMLEMLERLEQKEKELNDIEAICSKAVSVLQQRGFQLDEQGKPKIF